jgi:hypothetical protein
MRVNSSLLACLAVELIPDNDTTGLDWDMFFIGSCWDIPNVANRPKHQTYDDPFGPNSAE